MADKEKEHNAPVGAPDEGIEKFGYKQELKRALGLWDLVIYGLVWAVPIAPFVVYGYVVETAKGMVALVYLVTVIGVMFTANSYAKLSAEFPLAGSAYAYTSRGINNFIGFLIGWLLVLVYLLVPPLMYVFSALALSAILPGVHMFVWITIFVILVTLVNYLGIELTMKVNKWVLVGQMIVLVWFLAACILAVAKGSAGAGFTMRPFYDGAEFGFGVIMAAVSIAVLNFVGTDAITTLAEETRGGSKTIGIGMLLAVATLGFLFVVQTYVASVVWPDYTTFENADVCFYQIAELVGGGALKWAVTLAVVIAIGLACSICAQGSNARIFYGMSRDDMLPKILSRVHPKYRTPYLSTIIIGVISIIVSFAFAEQAATLTSLVNFGALLAFSFVNIAAVIYFMVRKKSKDYWAHLICPIIGLLVVGYAWISLTSDAMVLGFVWLGLGLLYTVYLKLVKKVKIGFSSDIGV